MYGIGGVFILCEWVVRMYQYCWDLCWIFVMFFEGFNDYFVGLIFIFVVNFFCGYLLCVGDGIVKIIGVGGVLGGEIQFGL